MSKSARTIPVKGEEFYRQAQARIAHITGHLSTAPRGGKLQGKVCVVTGVASLKGIGRASALLFAHEGTQHLYLIDYAKEGLLSLKDEVEKRYPDVKVTATQGDAADEALIGSICDRAIEEEGRLDVFFANAGIAPHKSFQDINSDDFMNTMRVNALSVFLAVKHASRVMAKMNPARGKAEGGGSIILTASVAGIRSGGGTVDYAASKAAVNIIAQTCACHLNRSNIRVNSICPGLIETGMTEYTFDEARRRGTDWKIGQLNPLGRYGVAEEIAQVALFLASDDSSYINAQNIAVDGGLASSMPVVPGKIA